MNKSKDEFIDSYIKKLEKGLENLKKSDFSNYTILRQKLIDTIMEIRNIFSGYISGVDEIILLKKGTEQRDTNSLIGKLKLYLILDNGNKEELREFINYHTEKLEAQVKKFRTMCT